MDFDAITTAMRSETTLLVQVWMNWMVFIFLLSLIFITKYKTALWAFIVIFCTAILVSIVWLFTGNVHLFALPHLLLWTPLALYLWRKSLSPTARAQTSIAGGLHARAHGVWVTALFITIIISLVFDVRDVFLVFTGQK